MNDVITYNLKPKTGLAIKAIVLCLPLLYICGYVAMGGLSSYRFFGVTFSPFIALPIAWAVFIAFSYFFIQCLRAFVGSLRKDSKLITLTKDSLIAPKKLLSKKYVTVRYSDINDLKLQKMDEYLFLHIHHRDGKLVVSSTALDDMGAFEDLVYRLNAARA